MIQYQKMYWEHINKRKSVFHWHMIVNNEEYDFELYKTRKENNDS